MLDFEWGNPEAAAAAMLLFGEDTGQIDNGHVSLQQQPAPHHHNVFDINHVYGSSGMDFFHLPPQPISAAASLFSASAVSAAACQQRYGLALPPAPSRIGLNLGGRTYFSSAPSPEDGMMVGRVCRRRTRTARCQAEGCGADLTHAKHYHRRHKVCEFHSKASIVVTAGLSQRFCQQCSRFHVLSEFDQGKRSCRKRLADHNRRRRKSQDLTTSPAIVDAAQPKDINQTNANNNHGHGDKTAACSSVTHATSPTKPPLPAPPMLLVLGCGANQASTGMSASSSTGTSPPQSMSFLSHLAEFREPEHRFPGWDEAEDGCTIRALFQTK